MLAFTITVGLVLGVVVGLAGTGGAFIIPALLYVFRLGQLKAQGTALFISALPIWIVAFIPYYKSGNFDLKLGLLLAIGVCLGSYFGASWAQVLPVVVLRKVFAAVLLLVAVKLWFSAA